MARAKNKNISNGLVSVIIPVYNRENIIERTLKSCFAQTYPYIEVIVVDDGSTDNSKDKVIKYAKEHNTKKKFIKYIYQENAGSCVARNKGLDNVDGEYVQFLDSDDTIESKKIELQVYSICEDSSDCALCDFKYINKDKEIIKYVENSGDIHEYTSKLRSVSVMTPLIRKSSMLDSLRWNPKLKRNQDMDFMFKYFLTVKKWSYVRGYYCNYFVHDGERISDSYHKGMQFLEMYLSLYKFYKMNIDSIPKSNFWIVNAYRNEIFKRWIEFNLKKILPESFISFFRKYRPNQNNLKK